MRGGNAFNSQGAGGSHTPGNGHSGPFTPNMGRNLGSAHNGMPSQQPIYQQYATPKTKLKKKQRVIQGPMIHGNHSYLSRKPDGYQSGELPQTNNKRTVTRGKDQGIVNIKTANWPQVPEVSGIEGAQMTPVNNNKQKLQPSSAMRLRNNYSDMNLSTGGNLPEEYKPSGRSSEKKGLG